MRVLVTGITSGLGNYLYNNLTNSTGLNRNNYNLVSHTEYDLIIHCAFNKDQKIRDHKQYLEDNIILTQKLKKINHKKFIYISSIDTYESETMYATFKRLAETLMGEEDLILRCSMILGESMKGNHFTKIKNNVERISLSGDSTFNYITMSEILKFVQNGLYNKYVGIIDFVSTNNIDLFGVKKLLNSSTVFGEYIYKTPENFKNPIYNLESDFKKTSYEKIIEFIK